jgi:hypothetical protein
MTLGRLQLPPDVADRIGPFYVYVLVDPRDDRPFYVGKGTRSRLLAHGFEADLKGEQGQSEKTARIREIRAGGGEPIVEVVRHRLEEPEAFLVEAALIDCLPSLTNKVRGRGASQRRAPLAELISRYGAPALEAIHPPVLMIRLKTRWMPLEEEMEKGYFREGAGSYPGIDSGRLYDAVRGWWKTSTGALERRGVRHVVAVVEGVTRAIYEIEESLGPRQRDGKWGFKGRLVESGALWEDYVGPLGRRVPFPAHSENPLVYWPRGA